ncbi:MAG: regulatory protein RecX [Stygiobacter sp.]|nr:MAG: regulatory protein RecX [Stygiobacter sp.]KAF0212212.1 MAG: regulatory protein [Ignavibacteria bacterium]
MTIAGFQKKGNDVIVAFDDGTFQNLDYRIVVDYGLWKGQEIDEKKIELLSHESSFLKARDSAFRFLGLRLHSTSELKLKLQKKKHPQEIIEKVLTYLAEKNYLNDEEFAKQFVSERIKRKKVGVGKLTAELIKKGIKRELIKENLLDIDQEKYLENAVEIAQKKLFQIRKKEVEERKISVKLYSFLAGKGYESDLIIKVIEKLKLQQED